MFGKWAYGFWQCKNRYDSQEELLGIAQKYRDLHIPLDNIVQDWFWWNTMGEPVFNKNYPDPKGMVDSPAQTNVHLMISVWPYFRPGSPVYDDMDKQGFFIDEHKLRAFHPPGMALYDAFNPEARKYYWNLMDNALFKIGADAWWLDTTEPETEGRETNHSGDQQDRAGEWRALRQHISADDNDARFTRASAQLPTRSASSFFRDRPSRAHSATRPPRGLATSTPTG